MSITGHMIHSQYLCLCQSAYLALHQPQYPFNQIFLKNIRANSKIKPSRGNMMYVKDYRSWPSWCTAYSIVPYLCQYHLYFLKWAKDYFVEIFLPSAESYKQGGGVQCCPLTNAKISIYRKYSSSPSMHPPKLNWGLGIFLRRFGSTSGSYWGGRVNVRWCPTALLETPWLCCCC